MRKINLILQISLMVLSSSFLVSCNLDQRGWFWHPGSEKIQEVKDVVERLILCNSRKSNYLLNVPPDTSGLLPNAYVETLRAIGENRKTKK